MQSSVAFSRSIGVELDSGEPHTSGTALQDACVFWFAYVYICDKDFNDYEGTHTFWICTHAKTLQNSNF